jgi:L-lactate dehydrogenase complex protein LldE
LDVSLFIPCFVDQLYPQVGIATVKILQELNCNVIYPEQQTCCGQPAFNTGYSDEAAQLAARFIEIFREAEYIVAPSGSCTAMVKNFYSELHLPESIRKDWSNLRNKIYELSDFLGSVLNIDKWEGQFPAKITYHDSCHTLRELRIKDQPRRLLQSITGLELIEMENSETCCGFGGTFSVKFPLISSAMVQNKASWIQQSGADIVVSTDSSCLMNINGYLQKQKINIQTMHLTEVLWRARENLKNQNEAV